MVSDDLLVLSITSISWTENIYTEVEFGEILVWVMMRCFWYSCGWYTTYDADGWIWIWSFKGTFVSALQSMLLITVVSWIVLASIVFSLFISIILAMVSYKCTCVLQKNISPVTDEINPNLVWSFLFSYFFRVWVLRKTISTSLSMIGPYQISSSVLKQYWGRLSVEHRHHKSSKQDSWAAFYIARQCTVLYHCLRWNPL